MQDNDDKENIIKEMESYRMKILENLKKYEEIEMKIYDINQLKIEASVELEEIKMKEEMVKEQLKGIHDNYLASIKKINSDIDEEAESAKIKRLIAERDNLRKCLAEHKRSNDEDNKKIEQIVKMIEVEKNRYTALLRRLKRVSQMKNIPQDLRDKANAFLNSPLLDDA